MRAQAPPPGRSINTAARCPSLSFHGGGRGMRKVSGARPYLHLIFFFLSTIFSSFLVFFLFSSLCRMEPVTFMRAVLLVASSGPTAAYLRPEGAGGYPERGGAAPPLTASSPFPQVCS